MPRSMGHSKKSYSTDLEAFSPQEKFSGWVGGRPNLMYSPGPGLSGSLSGSGIQTAHDLVLVMSLELDS